jgi:hypothetical protein
MRKEKNELESAAAKKYGNDCFKDMIPANLRTAAQI